VGGRKMSKSLGNMIRIRDAMKEYTAEELRFYFATTHYREPMVYSNAGILKARRRLSNLKKNFGSFLNSEPSTLDPVGKPVVNMLGYEAAFKRQMNDDFCTPEALKILEQFANQLAKSGRKLDHQSKAELEGRFRRVAGLLGILT